MSKPMGIGAVAREAGVGVETIRFYERQGLIAQPERKASGYRQYHEDVIAVLQFIRRAKELGFTLKEIAKLLALRLDASATRADVKQEAQRKVSDIDARIADLQKMRHSLHMLIKKCSGTGALSGCPIIESLRGSEGEDRSNKEKQHGHPAL